MKYNVWARGHSYTNSFEVSDKPAGKTGGWASIASFPVTDRYDEEVQRQRAYEYAAYLNVAHKEVPSISEVLG
jgi:hypothetical protein